MGLPDQSENYRKGNYSFTAYPGRCKRTSNRYFNGIHLGIWRSCADNISVWLFVSGLLSLNISPYLLTFIGIADYVGMSGEWKQVQCYGVKCTVSCDYNIRCEL